MKSPLKTTRCLGLLLPLTFVCAVGRADELPDHLIFFSSFDGTTTAETAGGDATIYTAATRREVDSAKQGLHNPDVSIAADQGLAGDALEFRKKTPIYTFYKAAGNVTYSKQSWSGAVSFWLQLDPAIDLEPGFCDPIQITAAFENRGDSSLSGSIEVRIHDRVNQQETVIQSPFQDLAPGSSVNLSEAWTASTHYAATRFTAMALFDGHSADPRIYRFPADPSSIHAELPGWPEAVTVEDLLRSLFCDF